MAPPGKVDVLVGREAEMAMLGASVDDALAGHSRFVLLTGEPGIGKTRTADEIAAYARQLGARVLWGRCYESEGAPPFWPWVQILRAAVGTVDDDLLQRMLADDGPQIAQLAPEIHARIPHLLPVPAADSEEMRQRFFESVGGFLERLAREQPLVIVADDLQGADPASVALLQFVVQSLAEGTAAPVLIVGSCRSAALADGSRLRHILTGLAGEDGSRWSPRRPPPGRVIATARAKASDGVSHPSVCRGRALSCVVEPCSIVTR